MIKNDFISSFLNHSSNGNIQYPYTILTQLEEKELYKNSFNYHKEKVLNFIQKKHLINSFFQEENTLNLLANISIFLSIYGLDYEHIFDKIFSLSSHLEIQHYFSLLNNELKKKKIFEKKIIKSGFINRITYGTILPDIFKEKSRIHIKIEDIPSLLFQIQKVVEHLNTTVPQAHHLNLKIDNSNLNKPSFFIIDEKKEIKIGRFLNSFCEQLNILKKIIQNLSPQKREYFFKLVQNNTLSIKEITHDINVFLKTTLEFRITLSTPLFFELKKISHFALADQLNYLNELYDFYSKQKESIHYMQIHTLPHLIDSKDENKGDMIILSTHPKDIARISEYTSWSTCMGQEEDLCYDLPMQIGAGSIVAYLVNSKNPHKRLGRILLKPYATPLQYKETTEIFDFFYRKTYKKELKKFELLIANNSSLVDIEKYELSLKKELENSLLLLLKNKKREPYIYLPDQQYGITNKLFLLYLSNIVKNHINTKETYGSLNTATNYYRDKLDHNYYFPNPNKPNNVIDFLTDNNIHVQKIEKNGETHYYTRSLILPEGTHGFNLNKITALYAQIHALDLKNNDNFILKVHNLTITEAEILETMPPNIRIKNALTLKSDKMIILPSFIHCKKLIVECPKLKIVPNEIDIEELTLVHSSVEKLPPIHLKFLDARHSQIQDISDLSITQHLDLSNTPIRYLPKTMILDRLFLRKCAQLKKLPSNLNVKWLDIGQTHISNLPALDYECLLMSFNEGVKSFPKGLSFNILEAQNAALTDLPANIRAEKIDISKTKIHKLPTNLYVHTLLINDTNIQEIPLDLECKELYANRCKINEIPPEIKVQVLHLNETPVKIIHYSKEIKNVYLSGLPDYIHPDFSVFRFIGISEDDVKLAQQRYQMKYLKPIQIIHQTKLNLNSSIDQFRTLE